MNRGRLRAGGRPLCDPAGGVESVKTGPRGRAPVHSYSVPRFPLQTALIFAASLVLASVAPSAGSPPERAELPSCVVVAPALLWGADDQARYGRNCQHTETAVLPAGQTYRLVELETRISAAGRRQVVRSSSALTPARMTEAGDLVFENVPRFIRQRPTAFGSRQRSLYVVADDGTVVRRNYGVPDDETLPIWSPRKVRDLRVAQRGGGVSVSGRIAALCASCERTVTLQQPNGDPVMQQRLRAHDGYLQFYFHLSPRRFPEETVLQLATPGRLAFADLDQSGKSRKVSEPINDRGATDTELWVKHAEQGLAVEPIRPNTTDTSQTLLLQKRPQAIVLRTDTRTDSPSGASASSCCSWELLDPEVRETRDGYEVEVSWLRMLLPDMQRSESLYVIYPDGEAEFSRTHVGRTGDGPVWTAIERPLRPARPADNLGPVKGAPDA